MAYLENQRIEIEVNGITVITFCDIDWNGFASNSEVYHMETINDIPAYYLTKDFRTDIERAILEHMREEKNIREEMRGDEEHRNN